MHKTITMRLLSILCAFLLTLSTVNAAAQPNCDNNEVIFTLETGVWASEIDFALFDSNMDSLFVFSSVGFNLEDNTVYTAILCLDDGCYTAAMYDAFGDGWNGAELTVSYNGTMISLGGLANGDYGQVDFGINADDCVTVVPGCTDPAALNYLPWANEDDGSCEYPFACENGTAAQLYVCTFANGTEVNLDILDDQGNVVFSVENQTSPIVYYDLCLEDSICYTIEMSNSAGNNGWYGGYFWVNVDGVQIVNDQLDPDSSFGLSSMSLDGSCPEFGCTDPTALNYDEEANEDDGSCEYPEECFANTVIANTFGGTFPGEIEWYLEDQNGTIVLEGPGSFDNNNSSQDFACIEDGCYTLTMIDTFGDGWNGAYVSLSIDGVEIAYGTFATGEISFLTLSINSECDEIIGGCTNPDAINYNPDATFDDGSCEWPYLGCTDPEATNYNQWANTDDGSCVYPIECETGVLAEIYICTFSNGQNVALEIVDENGNIAFEASGLNSGQILYFEACLDPDMCYTVNMSNTGGGTGWYGGYYWVNVDGVQIDQDELDNGLAFETTYFSINGTCPALGCTDPMAVNFNPEATEDDGSCVFIDDCNENLVVTTLTTLFWGEEVSWTLLDENQNTVLSGDGYVNDQVYTDYGCLADGCYTLILSDSFGDGWNGGQIEIMVNGEVVLSTTLEVGESQAVIVGINSTDCAQIVYGCTDPEATNYNEEATEDDGSCIYPIFGCTDPAAINYNYWANADDGSCYYEGEPCEDNLVSVGMITGTYGFEINWYIINDQGDQLYYGNGSYPDSLAVQNICLEDGCYTLEVNDLFGQGAEGGEITLTFEDGTTITVDLLNMWNASIPFGINSDCNTIEDIFGCTDPEALNYNGLATVDDGSCVYPGPYLGPSYALSGEDVSIEFNFAPNPVESVMLLTFNKLNPTQRLTVDIYDAVGRLVMAQDFGKTQEFFNTNINLESLESGAYIIVATNGASKVTGRLIKQ